MKKSDLSDRESIEIGIVKHYPFAKIAEAVNKETSFMNSQEQACISAIRWLPVKKGGWKRTMNTSDMSLRREIHLVLFHRMT